MSDGELASSLTGLLAAVDATPDDVPLRLHVADLLAARDRLPEALTHCTEAHSREPAHPGALALLQRLTTAISRPVEPGPSECAPFDWTQAEQEVGEPAFATEYRPDAVTEDVERPRLRLADVGGMEQVK